MADVTFWSLLSAAVGFGAKALWDSYSGYRDKVRLESWKIKTGELERRLSQFYWPLYAHLQRDDVIWQKVFYDLNSSAKSKKPRWIKNLSEDEQQRLGHEIENKILLPNHAEAVSVIRSFIHLANADSEFEDMLFRYVRHVDVYTSLRSAGCDVNPIDVGEEYPAGLSEAVRNRLVTYQHEYETLLQDRGVLDLRKTDRAEKAEQLDGGAEGGTLGFRSRFLGRIAAKLKNYAQKPSPHKSQALDRQGLFLCINDVQKSSVI
jgi:hypothetical protein